MQTPLISAYIEKNLLELGVNNWPDTRLESDSYILECIEVLKVKRLKEFSIEDIRILVSQEIGLVYLIPLALSKLKVNLLAEGDFYEGDLLNSVLNINNSFWRDFPDFKNELIVLLNDRKNVFDDFNGPRKLVRAVEDFIN